MAPGDERKKNTRSGSPKRNIQPDHKKYTVPKPSPEVVSKKHLSENVAIQKPRVLPTERYPKTPYKFKHTLGAVQSLTGPTRPSTHMDAQRRLHNRPKSKSATYPTESIKQENARALSKKSAEVSLPQLWMQTAAQSSSPKEATNFSREQNSPVVSTPKIAVQSSSLEEATNLSREQNSPVVSTRNSLEETKIETENLEQQTFPPNIISTPQVIDDMDENEIIESIPIIEVYSEEKIVNLTKETSEQQREIDEKIDYSSMIRTSKSSKEDEFEQKKSDAARVSAEKTDEQNDLYMPNLKLFPCFRGEYPTRHKPGTYQFFQRTGPKGNSMFTMCNEGQDLTPEADIVTTCEVTEAHYVRIGCDDENNVNLQPQVIYGIPTLASEPVNDASYPYNTVNATEQSYATSIPCPCAGMVEQPYQSMQAQASGPSANSGMYMNPGMTGGPAACMPPCMGPRRSPSYWCRPSCMIQQRSGCSFQQQPQSSGYGMYTRQSQPFTSPQMPTQQQPQAQYKPHSFNQSESHISSQSARQTAQYGNQGGYMLENLAQELNYQMAQAQAQIAKVQQQLNYLTAMQGRMQEPSNKNTMGSGCWQQYQRAPSSQSMGDLPNGMANEEQPAVDSETDIQGSNSEQFRTISTTRSDVGKTRGFLLEESDKPFLPNDTVSQKSYPSYVINSSKRSNQFEQPREPPTMQQQLPEASSSPERSTVSSEQQQQQQRSRSMCRQHSCHRFCRGCCRQCFPQMRCQMPYYWQGR